MNLILALLFSDMPLEKISQFTALVNQDQHSRVISEHLLFLQHGCLGDTGALWGQCRSTFRKSILLISFFMIRWPPPPPICPSTEPSRLFRAILLQSLLGYVVSVCCWAHVHDLHVHGGVGTMWHQRANRCDVLCPACPSQPLSSCRRRHSRKGHFPQEKLGLWPWEGHWLQKTRRDIHRSIDSAQVIDPHPIETDALLQNEREPRSE